MTTEGQESAPEGAWEEEVAPPSAITVDEMKLLGAKIEEHRLIVESKNAELTHEKTILEGMEAKFLGYLKNLNLPNFRSDNGSLFSKVIKRSWSLPKTDEARAQFFDWLKERGTFESAITVHSAKFNSIVTEVYEEFEKAGKSAEFKVPGVGPEATFESLRLLKKGK